MSHFGCIFVRLEADDLLEAIAQRPGEKTVAAIGIDQELLSAPDGAFEECDELAGGAGIGLLEIGAAARGPQRVVAIGK